MGASFYHHELAEVVFVCGRYLVGKGVAVAVWGDGYHNEVVVVCRSADCHCNEAADEQVDNEGLADHWIDDGHSRVDEELLDDRCKGLGDGVID